MWRTPSTEMPCPCPGSPACSCWWSRAASHAMRSRRCCAPPTSSKCRWQAAEPNAAGSAEWHRAAAARASAAGRTNSSCRRAACSAASPMRRRQWWRRLLPYRARRDRGLLARLQRLPREEPRRSPLNAPLPPAIGAAPLPGRRPPQPCAPSGPRARNSRLWRSAVPLRRGAGTPRRSFQQSAMSAILFAVRP